MRKLKDVVGFMVGVVPKEQPVRRSLLNVLALLNQKKNDELWVVVNQILENHFEIKGFEPLLDWEQEMIDIFQGSQSETSETV